MPAPTQTNTPQTPQRSRTKWEALKNFYPTEILCQAYPPYHKVDPSCHTRLTLSAEAIARHAAACGGGIMLSLRRSDKPVKLWDQLAEAGLEAVDFRCEICDKQLPFHSNHLDACMKPHAGKSRRVKEGGHFNVTIKRDYETAADEAFEENG